MMYKLNWTASCLLLLSCWSDLVSGATDGAAITEMQELKNGDNLEELTTAYDFAVISFYKPSDEKSVELQKYIEGAQAYFNTMIDEESGKWQPREVGWFKVDIESED